MDHLEVLDRMYRYDRWANREILECVKQLDTVPTGVLPILSHLVAAQQLWLDRLHSDEQSTPVWPDQSLAEIEQAMDRVEAAWTLFIEHQRDEKLSRPIAYTNSKGQPWASRVEEIMHHVALHSAYHRGQIALQLRGSGINPPLTDFVHAVRTGAVS